MARRTITKSTVLIQKIAWDPEDGEMIADHNTRAWLHSRKFGLHKAYEDDWGQVIDRINEVTHYGNCEFY